MAEREQAASRVSAQPLQSGGQPPLSTDPFRDEKSQVVAFPAHDESHREGVAPLGIAPVPLDWKAEGQEALAIPHHARDRRDLQVPGAQARRRRVGTRVAHQAFEAREKAGLGRKEDEETGGGLQSLDRVRGSLDREAGRQAEMVALPVVVADQGLRPQERQAGVLAQKALERRQQVQPDDRAGGQDERKVQGPGAWKSFSRRRGDIQGCLGRNGGGNLDRRGRGER
jgi:hypothetical protein